MGQLRLKYVKGLGHTANEYQKQDSNSGLAAWALEF